MGASSGLVRVQRVSVLRVVSLTSELGGLGGSHGRARWLLPYRILEKTTQRPGFSQPEKARHKIQNSYWGRRHGGAEAPSFRSFFQHSAQPELQAALSLRNSGIPNSLLERDKQGLSLSFTFQP